MLKRRLVSQTLERTSHPRFFSATAVSQVRIHSGRLTWRPLGKQAVTLTASPAELIASFPPQKQQPPQIQQKDASHPPPSLASVPTKPLSTTPVITFPLPSSIPLVPSYFSPHISRATSFFASPDTPPPAFLYSATKFSQHIFNEHIPEVLIIGCSNAGKSTFINKVLGTNVARSSQTPGFTKMLNVFAGGPVIPGALIKEWTYACESEAQDGKRGFVPKMSGKVARAVWVVDSPGYGYKSRREWGVEVDKYMRKRGSLRGIIFLLRAEVPLTGADVKMLRIMGEVGRGKRVCVVFTRADKCGKKGREESDWREGVEERVCEVRKALKGVDTTAWEGDVFITAAGGGGDGGIAGGRVAVLRCAGLVSGRTWGEMMVMGRKKRAKETKIEGEEDKEGGEKQKKKKIKRVDYELGISEQNKKLEEGPSEHEGFGGNIVSWNEVMSNNNNNNDGKL